VAPSGLFWTVPLPEDAVAVSANGRRLTVAVRDLPLVDDVLRPVPDTVPATASFRIDWRGKGRLRRRGRGLAVPATDPGAFLGVFFRRATARGTFSGAIDGFAFASDATRPARSRWALLGTERNGVFRSEPRCGRCRVWR
jgi:hypothetical protein